MHLAVSKGGEKNVTGPMSEMNVQNITKFHQKPSFYVSNIYMYFCKEFKIKKMNKGLR